MIDFKIYLPGREGEENTLVFHAWIADRESYYLQEVPGLGIHKTYEKLLIDLLNGSLSTNAIEIGEDGQVSYIEKSVSECTDENINAYLEYGANFLRDSFGSVIEIDSFEMHPMIDLRFDSHNLNYAHGIKPGASKKIYNFSNELIDIMQANNTDYGGVLQAVPKASSTLVPYLTDQLDDSALEILRRCINDINHGNVDRDFANSTDPFASLYKKFTKKMSELKSVKDLETFRISLYKIDGEKVDLDINLEQLSTIDNQLFGNTVQHEGTIRQAAYQMKSQPHIHRAEVDIDGIVYSIHLNSFDESFPRLKRVLRENEGRNIRIDGYQKGERTIEASHISVLQEEEDLTTTPPAE